MQIFLYLAQNLFDIRQYACIDFVQSNEKSDFASDAQSLCGIAFSEYGKQAGEPYIKHLDGDIWELRPLRDRVLFVGWTNDSYVLLHHFMKKTQKTPIREIEKAKCELADLIERSVIYE